MTNPVITPLLLAASIGSTALGAVNSASGAKAMGQSQKQMYDYQAGVAEVNKKISLQNKDYALKVGETQAQVEGMKTRSQIGTARAQQSASGLDVNQGSSKDIRESIAAIGDQNSAVVRADAAKRAYGYEVEANQATTQGEVYKMAGRNAMQAGQINANASILGGVSSVSNKWLQASNSGMFGSGQRSIGGDKYDSSGNLFERA